MKKHKFISRKKYPEACKVCSWTQENALHSHCEPVEQSKTPKEEQCDFCEDPENCEGVKCQPKTVHTESEECRACGKEYIGSYGKHLQLYCEPKTEDTGECKCFNTIPCPCGGCGGKWSCSESCAHCKASGVSKEATNEDSHDTLSPSENKEESMEDRFEKYPKSFQYYSKRFRWLPFWKTHKLDWRTFYCEVHKKAHE